MIDLCLQPSTLQQNQSPQQNRREEVRNVSEVLSTELSAEGPTLASTAHECGSALSLTLVVRSLSGERA